MKKSILLVTIIGLWLLGCTPLAIVRLSAEPVETFSKQAADGSVVAQSAIRGGRTKLSIIDPATAKTKTRFSYEGQWIVTAVSPNGNYFVLTQHPTEELKASWRLTDQWFTIIEVRSAEDGSLRHSIQLEGNFEVEAIDNLGHSLYLIEHIPAINPEKYLVRLYDLTIEELALDPLRDKRISDEFMTGYAWGTSASANGEWLMTLYMNANRNHAFIHALNLNNRFTLCLDLPSGDGDFEKLEHYTLALAPDNQTVYAANAALGRVVGISLIDLERTKSAVFAPMQLSKTEVMHASTMNGDGSQLYFSADNTLWVYDIYTSTVGGPQQLESTIQQLHLIDDTLQVTFTNMKTTKLQTP